MKSITAVMISIIIIIAVSGKTANSQPDKELLGGGSKFVKIDKTKIDAASTESIIKDSGRKLTRRSPGGDGGEGSVGWWMFGYNRLDDSKITVVTESTQGVLNRNKRNAPINNIFGGRSSGSNQLSTSKISPTAEVIASNQISTSTVSTTTKHVADLHWKWLATGGYRKCSYDMNNINCLRLQ